MVTDTPVVEIAQEGTVGAAILFQQEGQTNLTGRGRVPESFLP